MLQLTQKETDLLKDMKDQERLCADKYTRHAQCACDPQLKNLFSQIATVENEHWNTLDQICRGTVPVPSGVVRRSLSLPPRTPPAVPLNATTNISAPTLWRPKSMRLICTTPAFLNSPTPTFEAF
jgi:hypothetical protein